MKPLVSVAMGVYNVERFITAAVESVLNQTYEHIDLVVVDDGSTDGTVSRLEEVRDARLTVVRCAHRGSAATRNEAIRRTKGKYVGLLDGDDLYLRQKLERHVEFFESNSGLDVSFSLAHTIDEDGMDIDLPSLAPESPLSFESLLVANPITGSSAIVRKSALEISGLIDETLPGCLDYDLWLRLALLREDNFHCLPEVLSLYRRRRGQITGDWRRMERAWSMMMKKLATIASTRIDPVYSRAACNWYRYLAYIADNQDDLRAALRCLARSVRLSPRRALRNPDTYRLGSAVLSRFLLPHGVHHAIRTRVRRILSGHAI